MSDNGREEMGASVRWSSEPRSTVDTLRVKREIRESQLAYARSVGDVAKVRECEAALVTIARWEREYGS